MNVYDFDKTIYPMDSASHFWRWCVARYPAALLAIPAAAPALPAFLRGDPAARGTLKERFFSFLRYVPDPERAASDFWDENFCRIYPWYLAQKRPDDLVISASPYFLIGEVCRRLEIRCIATDMDPATGKLRGPNCWGAEKPVRFRAEYPDATVDGFWSDSFSDRPMMDLARSAYLMKKGAVAQRVR